MTSAWMLYILGVGTMLAVGAELLAMALRHVGQPMRLAHAAALASMLVLAVAAPGRKAAEPTTLSGTVSTTAPLELVVREPTLLDRVHAARKAVGDAANAFSGAVQRRLPLTTARIALGAWTSMSLSLLVLFLVVNRGLSNTCRSCEMRVVDGTPVRMTPNVGPAVVGFLRAEIVIPPRLFERSAEELRLILSHEREHLRAGDHLLLGAAWLAAIALPWHPAVWYLVNRIRLAIEIDCDGRVLRAGASPRSYGMLLIEMATRQSAMRIGALALADARSHLERRIRAMHWRRGRLGVPRGLVLGAAGGLVVLVACEAKVPTVAEVASMDVGTLEKKAAELDRVDGKFAKADYFVNGTSVSADSARSIAAAKIASVGVMKARSGGGRDTIQITTVDRMPPRQRTNGDDALIPYPRGLSSDATLLIDGVLQTPGMKVRQDPKEIASIQVMKPGKDPKYPNGLVAIETKGYALDATRTNERNPIITRTDSVVVSSARGLASASRLWSDRAVGAPDRVVLMPRDSSGSYKFSVADLERARSAATFDTAQARAKGVTMDPTKPIAIEIDGKRASKAELDQLRSTKANLTYTMYPHDMSAESSDPAAKNALLRVTTKMTARQ